MMKYSFKTLMTAAAVAASLLVAGSAHATLMISIINGDPSTGDFDKITPVAGTPEVDGGLSLSSYNGITFADGNGEALTQMLPGTTVNGVDGNWWSPNTYPIFTTGIPSDSSEIIIDFSNAGYDVYGFSFQIGANKSATGWVEAYWGSGASERVNSIAISPGTSPGVQVASAAGSCTAITKIAVEPPFTWGIFNMGMDTTGDNCVQVPEPGSLSLLGFGLLGLALLQAGARRRLRVTA